VPVGPIVEALNEHHRAGRIRAFGGSNWTHGRIAEANGYAKDRELVPFAATSPNFSLANRVKEPWAGCIAISGPGGEEARQWYAREKTAVFAWSSMARGFFSGRITRANYESIKDTIDNGCRQSFCYEENFQRLDRVEMLAREKGVSVPQIAMAYVMSQPLDVFALVGAANREECAANVAALEIKLTAHEIEWLDLRSETR